MSEVFGSDEIEDVVSSVRRLVSPEVRPRPVSRDLAMGKLLLTPAQQVEPDAPRVDPLILTERAVDAVDAPAEAIGAEAILDQAAVDDAPMAEAAIEEPAVDPVVVEPGPFDDLFAPAVAAEPGDAVLPDDGPEVTLQVVEGEWEDAFWSEAEPALSEIALEAEEAVLVSADPAPWAQDEGIWSEDAAAAPRSPGAVGDGSLTDADGNPVTLLDEAALNDIVRALIREELQGVLGERITQNVRKLVRAEINRALTARSLD